MWEILDKIKHLHNRALGGNFYLVLIIVIGAFVRFYLFTQNPPSLYVDEVSHGYNAYSILKTGRDEYGEFMPFFIRSFNIWNPPLAVYTLVPTIALFGASEFAIRLPSAVAGTLLIPLLYLLALKLFKDKNLALISAFFLAINPWAIHFSRFYHESNLTLFFSLLGLVLFLHADKKKFLYLLSALSWGIAINYSHGAKVIVPLLIIISTILYLKFSKKTFKIIVLSAVILVISFLPHILNTDVSLSRAGPVSIFTNDVGDKKEKFIDGYLSHFSGNFLFIRGDYQGRHSVPGVGELFIFQIPLVIFGLYALIKMKSKSSLFVLLWLLISPIPAALSIPTPHAGRALFFVVAWAIVSAHGLMFMLKNLKRVFLIPLLIIAIYNVITYFHLYYSHYPKEKALDWAGGYKQMAQFVGQNYNNYERIAITRYWGHPYIYILFYTKYDPKKYQPQSENKYAFDKYEFFLGAPEKSNKKTLYVSTAEHKDNVLKEIKINNTDTLFVVHE